MRIHVRFSYYKRNKCSLWKFMWTFVFALKLFYDDLCCINKSGRSQQTNGHLWNPKGPKMHLCTLSVCILSAQQHFKSCVLAFDLTEFFVICLGPS